MQFLTTGRSDFFLPLSSVVFFLLTSCLIFYGVVRYLSLRRKHQTKIRSFISEIVSRVSEGDFSTLLSDYSCSLSHELSLVKSDQSGLSIAKLPAELSRLSPTLKNRFPWLIILCVRILKYLKNAKWVSTFHDSSFGRATAAKLDQFIQNSDDLDKLSLPL